MVMGRSGVTSIQTGRLEEGLNRMVASASVTREYKGRISQLCERHMLKRGTGVAWIEPQFDKLYAQDITPHQEVYNPQQQRIVRVLQIVPRAVSVQRLLTDETSVKMSPIAWRKMGSQMMEAMTRKMDIDGLAAFNATTKTYGASGASFDFNLIRAASDRMLGNPEEPVMGQINCVAHRYQITDIDDQLVGGWAFTGNPATGLPANREISSGVTADVFRRGFRGRISDVEVHEDNHIAIGGNSANAVVFARESLVLINDQIMSRETDRRPLYGEGAELVIMRAKYQYGLRRPHLWSALITSDASEPT